METNLGPTVQLGPLSELPSSDSEPLGAFFLDTGTGNLYMNEAAGWAIVAHGGGAIGLNQVAYGNAAGGITSDANFIRDPVTGDVRVLDNNGFDLFVIQGDPAQRLVTIFDENGVIVTRVSALQANRIVETVNDAGTPIMQIDTKSASQKMSTTVPFGLGLFTLLQANALTPALGKVEGATCYITDGHKPGEVAPTGVPAYYSAAGPAGAGWYNFGLATLVA